MKYKSRGEKGQFSLIAALLVSTILVAAVLATYAAIRNPSIQDSPKVLSSIEEMNLSLKNLLEFTVGYYNSILQVTGNSTYAKGLALSYLRSGFVYIAHSRPEWNPSFEVGYLDVSTRWFEPTSYSMGNLSVTYSLSGLDTYGVNYTASTLFQVEVLESTDGQAKVLVTGTENKPNIMLDRENFYFYKYNYSDSAWQFASPDGEPMVFSNGTYVLQIPEGVDQTSYSIRVVNPNGVVVNAFTSPSSPPPQHVYTFAWNDLYASLQKSDRDEERDTIVVEALQNGTLRWLGHDLLTTQGRPIPPLPVKAFRVNQTIDGVNMEVPFQVEDWGSNYQVPLGLSSNVSLFDSRRMIVFLVNHRVQNVTLWWDGWDTANQTSYAVDNRYFNDDPGYDPDYGLLTNGILTLKIISRSGSSNVFVAETSLGSSTSTARFMRLNGELAQAGSRSPAYIIYNGVVRDIVQQEVEWGGGGAPGSPNVYSHIVLTLPANATYYTYALRTIFVDSSQIRDVTDLSILQLSSDWISGTGLRSFTEDGMSGGFPVVAETIKQRDLFYDFSSSMGWAHHWSEYIKGKTGAGVMFTTSSNRKLYAFDGIAGDKTGALDVTHQESDNNRKVTIEVNPVVRFEAAFTTPMEVTWHGAVVTFDGDDEDTIYPSTGGNVGLWVIVEYPPTITIS